MIAWVCGPTFPRLTGRGTAGAAAQRIKRRLKRIKNIFQLLAQGIAGAAGVTVILLAGIGIQSAVAGGLRRWGGRHQIAYVPT